MDNKLNNIKNVSSGSSPIGDLAKGIQLKGKTGAITADYNKMFEKAAQLENTKAMMAHELNTKMLDHNIDEAKYGRELAQKQAKLELAGKVYHEGKNLIGSTATGAKNLVGGTLSKGVGLAKGAGKAGLLLGGGVVAWDLLHTNQLQKMQNAENNARLAQYMAGRPISTFSDPEKYRIKEKNVSVRSDFSDPEKFRVI